MEIILGSGSPRRRYILEGIFGNIKVISPFVDESLKINETAEDYAERVSILKADAVVSALNTDENYCVITSDTIVSIDGKILGKPRDEDDAVSMLQMLSGREHFVLTGICIIIKNMNNTARFYSCEKTSVNFKILDDSIIKKYLGMINYSDKAGSYAIQEHGDLIVESISGSMTNIIGFPLRLFFRMLISTGLAGIIFNRIKF